ncbi:hypothetical protein EDD15DRAFT_1765611 [Pisolithus albus]|nr:hypothetical protein EDD15DRAFT_1765611 [Pisolithus albus]
MPPLRLLLEPNDPLRVLLPSLEVTQAPVGNGQFEKVSCSSQEEQVFAFCYPETVGKTSIPVADCNTLSPTLSPIRENHSIGNTSTPSFQRTSTSEDYLPMSTRSPYAVSDCAASNHSCTRTALLHATPSPRPCKSERSTAIKRVDVVRGVSQDAQSTPGPAYYCYKPCFNFTTEDDLSCNATEDSSFVSDIDAIDFRWEPFPRSKVNNGHPAPQRESDSSQPISLHSPVSGVLPSGALGFRSPVCTATSPVPSTPARRRNARLVCCPSASDGLRYPPCDQFSYLSDREESRIPCSQRAFSDEHLAMQAEPCKFMNAHPSRLAGTDTRARCPHP